MEKVADFDSDELSSEESSLESDEESLEDDKKDTSVSSKFEGGNWQQIMISKYLHTYLSNCLTHFSV